MYTIYTIYYIILYNTILTILTVHTTIYQHVSPSDLTHTKPLCLSVD